MVTLSNRSKKVPPSPIRKLMPFADAAKKDGKTIYHLNIGQPDLPTPAAFLDNIRQYKDKTVSYAPAHGVPELVHAWQNFYDSKGHSFYPQDIIVTAGGAEAIIFALLAMCDKGDELLVFEPFYTSYAMFAAMLDVVLVPVTTRIGDGFHLPEKNEITKKITHRTKAMLVVNPNNPTGTIYTEEEIRTLAEIAQDNNLYILSDETYQEIVFDGKKVPNFSAFPEIKDNLIIVDSLSKRMNVCGARIGCIASYNTRVMEAVHLFAQARLSVGIIEQKAIAPVFEKSQQYFTDVCAEYEKRRNIVVEHLQKMKDVRFMIPEGAFYIILGLPVDDADHFAKYLLTDFSDQNETVMVAPANGFYISPQLGKNEIRIAYVLESPKLKRAMDLLSMAITTYQQTVS